MATPTPKVEKDPDSGMESSVSSLSSTTINEQVGGQILLRKKRVFYSDYADGAFKFENGKELKVSRALLASESSVLDKLFRESSLENIIEIKDYDFDAFKLFLNCLMGFQNCTISEALIVFPIAWDFKTENFIEKCLNILRPVKMNENVCLALNVALICECEELRRPIIHFFSSRYCNALTLFHEEKYYSLLEPESVVEMFKNELVRLDSYNLVNIFKWGKNHITKNNISMDLKSFFVEKGIDKFLTADCFETKGCFYEFYKSDLGKDYFTFSDYEYVAEEPKFKEGTSFWQNVTVNEVLTENLRIKNAVFLEKYETCVTVCRHPVTFYCLPQNRAKIFMKAEYRLKVTELNHKVIKAEEKRTISKDPKRFKFVIKVNLNSDVISDLDLEIKRTFYVKGRILKQSPVDFEPITQNAGNMYFTSSVAFKPEKKSSFFSVQL